MEYQELRPTTEQAQAKRRPGWASSRVRTEEAQTLIGDERFPYLPPVPAQMLAGALDPETGKWVDSESPLLEMYVPPLVVSQMIDTTHGSPSALVTKQLIDAHPSATEAPRPEVLDLTFRYQYGEEALPVLANGDKRMRTQTSEVDQISAKALALNHVGIYFGPYDMICRNSGSLSSTLSVIIPKYLGDEWAIVQILQSFGRQRNGPGEMSIYGFLYTIGWNRFEDPQWQIIVRKVHVHKACDSN